MLQDKIFKINSRETFEAVALEVFRFQAQNNAVYKEFIHHLNIDVSSVERVEQIPFLPIQFFKSHQVLSSVDPIQEVFTSSGTGGVQSQHFVTDLSLYIESFRQAFKYFYGNVSDYTVLALLPSYLERKGSSLILMAQDMIEQSNDLQSGFFLNEIDDLIHHLKSNEARGKKTLLLGVSFALLDVVEAYQLQLNHTIVMETGGMKGRRKELIRRELHEQLSKGFGVPKIHSEYGMTELLSQAYSKGDGIFESPPWMDILIRDSEDALSLLPNGRGGGINIIDLANINSCSFIATQDLGKKYDNGTFEVLGRFDNSDIRGCNLMII